MVHMLRYGMAYLVSFDLISSAGHETFFGRMHATIGRVVFSGLYPRLAGLEAPPMRCLKHQKYGWRARMRASQQLE